jgi:hypothetical protein
MDGQAFETKRYGSVYLGGSDVLWMIRKVLTPYLHLRLAGRVGKCSSVEELGRDGFR